jgi:hypothetical protein
MNSTPFEQLAHLDRLVHDPARSASEQPSLTPEDLDRIRFVTRNFQRLQGFRRTALMGLGYLTLGFLGVPSQPLLWLLLTAGAYLHVLASRDVLARFGEVESKPTMRNDLILLVSLLVLAFAFEELAKRGLYPRDLHAYALAALFFLVHFFWLFGGPRRYVRHYLVLGALFLVAALPGRPLATFLLGLDRHRQGLVLFGLASILAGLLDHQLLVRSLGQAPVFSEEATALEIES